jgi:hypothetical protein
VTAELVLLQEKEAMNRESSTENTRPRTNSVVSELSSDDLQDSALMKLVDAASLLHRQMREVPEKTCGAEVPISSPAISCREELRSETDGKECRVVIGTKADLDDSCNRRASFAGKYIALMSSTL